MPILVLFSTTPKSDTTLPCETRKSVQFCEICQRFCVTVYYGTVAVVLFLRGQCCYCSGHAPSVVWNRTLSSRASTGLKTVTRNSGLLTPTNSLYGSRSKVLLLFCTCTVHMSCYSKKEGLGIVHFLAHVSSTGARWRLLLQMTKRNVVHMQWWRYATSYALPLKKIGPGDGTCLWYCNEM